MCGMYVLTIEKAQIFTVSNVRHVCFNNRESTDIHISAPI